jgi:hypothetical protein
MDTEGLQDLGGHHSVFLRQRLLLDFTGSDVQVPRNDTRSHRLNTTLRAMVEIAGDQPYLICHGILESYPEYLA